MYRDREREECNEIIEARNTVGLNIINAYMISVLIKMVKIIYFFFIVVFYSLSPFLSFSFVSVHSIITIYYNKWR